MRIAKKAMELPKDGSGTAFYRFENMKDSANAFKKKYRILMDQTPVDAEVRERKGCVRCRSVFLRLRIRAWYARGDVFVSVPPFHPLTSCLPHLSPNLLALFLSFPLWLMP